MGMYTSITHPEDGRELQIKTGNDECDTYRVGDQVKWRINHMVGGWGTLLDGIYSSYHVPDFDDDDEDEIDWETFDGTDVWVVIKDHKIIALEDKNKSYDDLFEQYDIQDPDPSLWSDKAWRFFNDAQDKAHNEYEEIKRLPEDEQFSAVIGWLGSSRLNYQEIGRKLLQVDEIPQGSLARYDRSANIARNDLADGESDDN